MNNDDEKLPPELAAFEARLKTLKPSGVTAFVNTRNGSRERSERSKRSDRIAPRVVRSLRYAPFPAAIGKRRVLLLTGGLTLATAVSLMVAVVFFGLLRPLAPDNELHIVENPMPERIVPETPEEITPVLASSQQQPGTHSTSNTKIFRGVTMREQLAMLLDEMQPQVDMVIEPKRPDYPVMVITVGHDTRPLSPEAKQAFQRRLRGVDYEIAQLR